MAGGRWRFQALAGALMLMLMAVGAPVAAESGWVDLSHTGDGKGWWAVDADGAIAHGGSARPLTVDTGAAAVVDSEPTPDGRGLYVLTNDAHLTLAIPYPDNWYPEPDHWWPEPDHWYPEPDDWAAVDVLVGPEGQSAWLLATPADGGGGGKLFRIADRDATHMPMPDNWIPHPDQWFPVDLARTPSGDGVWVAEADGNVVAFGDARELPAVQIPYPDDWVTVDVEATASGKGLWLLGADGTIATTGDADHHGNLAIPHIDEWVPVGLEPTPSGEGYRVLDSRGQVSGFGDATPHHTGPPLKKR